MLLSKSPPSCACMHASTCMLAEGHQFPMGLVMINLLVSGVSRFGVEV
jgi:hypothetical protein